MRGLCAIGVLAAGCWTSGPGTATITAPSDRGPSRASRALASQLADELRDREDSMFIDRFIEGQLVVLERETATVQILCDAQTLTAAVRFSELLNDPDRQPATCAPTGAGYVCTQGTGADLVWLDFRRVEDAWRLVGGILPRGPVPASGDARALLREYRTKLDVAVCPP